MKKIRVLSLVLAMSLLMTACKKEENSSSDTKSDSKTEQTTASTSDKSNPEESKVGYGYKLNGDLPQEVIDISRVNEANEVRLAKFFKKLENKEEVTVGFIGGSITQGDSAGKTLCYSNKTVEWLKSKYPDVKVNYVNAGIGATGSYIGVHRVDEDLLSSKPDLVFVEYSVNDYTDFTQRNKETYDGLIRKIWLSETSPAVITLALTQDNGTSFQNHHKIIADAYEIPMISYKDAIFELINKGDIVWKDISNDNIHPNVEGHDILAKLITSYLDDVLKRAASITGEEPDIIMTPAVSDRFMNAKILRANDLVPTKYETFKQDAQKEIGKFHGVWMTAAQDGKFNGASITFEVEAKNIALLYGELVGNGAKVIVKIDGEQVAEIDSNFPDGWGDYAYAQELKSYDTSAKRVIEIIPQDAENYSGVQLFMLAGLLVS